MPRTFWLDTLHAVLAATREGLGIALIPPAIVQPEIDEGRLMILDIPTPISALPFHAQFRKNARLEICSALCDVMGDLAVRTLIEDVRLGQTST